MIGFMDKVFGPAFALAFLVAAFCAPERACAQTDLLGVTQTQAAAPGAGPAVSDDLCTALRLYIQAVETYAIWQRGALGSKYHSAALVTCVRGTLANRAGVQPAAYTDLVMQVGTFLGYTVETVPAGNGVDHPTSRVRMFGDAMNIDAFADTIAVAN